MGQPGRPDRLPGGGLSAVPDLATLTARAGVPATLVASARVEARRGPRAGARVQQPGVHRMIEEVDETLRGLIKTEVLSGSQVEVSFDAPTKDWAARRNAPTINLYLYDIREDLSRRDAAWAPVYSTEGYVTGHRPMPRHYKLQYMVTAWTQRPEDEHRLLSACLGTFLRHETLGPAEMTGALAEQSLPAIVSVALPLGPDRSIADVWSALGGELKPSLDLVFNAPFVVGRGIVAGAPVRELPRLSIARADDAGQPERPRGRNGAAARGRSRPRRCR